MTPASAAVTRATCAAVFAAITMSLCAARIHAQCVPAPPFTDARVYYHLDQVGSVHLLTDASGQVEQETRHYPYGPFIGNQPVASASPFGFAGHRNVESHGLAYFEARYYVPELAIFASRDPAAQFQNPYTYADGDPLSLRDPDGKAFLPALIAGLLFIGELVLDDFLSPAPTSPQDGLLTGEQQALQPAPMPFESGPRRLGAALGPKAVGIANGAVEKGAVVVDEVIEAAARGGATAGQTVLGHFPGYVETAKGMGARYFDVPTKIWDSMTPAEQWAANARFLDRLIARGDEVVLSTPAAAARAGSSFARELEYLSGRGFLLAEDGMGMLPPRP